ncbi:hypothetical protein OSB04_025045 [Centaurea solstitialis]|uniref:Protein kinase domain-containing protein n=1 Tax=Centaurea solstitialis TaxID=347529 RepID=A0AA38SMY5_9ASTR|nr:hypothetical protein OSB04_025045 [Centaurea solstitialis]
MRLLFTLVLFTLPLTPQSSGGNLQSSTAIARGNIAKRGCQTHCGNLTVPYPFGIGVDRGCSLDESFDLNCSSTENPPKLFYGSTYIEIYNISDFEVRVSNDISFTCYNQKGNVDGQYNAEFVLWNTPFSFSQKNKFTVIGCDDLGSIITTNFSTGCWGTCNEKNEVSDDEHCSGNGCCQTSIAKGLKDYITSFFSFDNHTKIQSFNPCGMAFLGEEDRFKFLGASDLNNIDELIDKTLSSVPIVLYWVIGGNGSCKEATECKGNSFCKNADISGYHCICKEGYEGNPYLDAGCQDFLALCVDFFSSSSFVSAIDEKKGTFVDMLQMRDCYDSLLSAAASTTNNAYDINECEDKSKYPCHGDCSNTPGGYNCTCPHGYSGGDPKSRSGCLRVRKNSKLLVLFWGHCYSFSIFSLWLVKVVHKRKLKKLKAKFFKRNGGLLLQQQLSSGEGIVDHQPRFFTSTELEKATGQFGKDRILGHGGQGTVYKGMLADGRIVAVKKSTIVDERQVEAFINEVFILSQIIHKNVVKLLGSCLESEVPMLVYEFVGNGTLFEFIHDENYEFPTLWKLRLQIATEIARALAYLHSVTSIPIYHRDIKSSNILLDDKFRAKVSDFGISKSFSCNQTHLSTSVKGTMGYLDPEYFQSSHLTDKSDVYSFGVVLLELLTGKDPIFRTHDGERMSLVTFVLSMEDEQVVENVDDRVSDAPKEQLIAVANLAKRCINLNGMLRPNMKDVATELEAIRSC